MFGQKLVTAMTGKELFSYQLFKALHLLADRGLGTAYRGGGGRKGIEIGDRDKSSQQIEVEIKYRAICVNHNFFTSRLLLRVCLSSIAVIYQRDKAIPFTERLLKHRAFFRDRRPDF